MPNRRVITCYGIRKGRDAPIVVGTWAEVVSKTSDFPGAEFKKFKSIETATAYIQDSGESANAGPAPPGSFTLLFDGGSRGNPGVSGAGAALFDDREQEIWSGYRYVGDKNTNNEAEYSGLILGLQAAIRLGIQNIIVKGDSQLVIQQMLGRWRVSAPKLMVMHKQATLVVKQGDLVCTWQHVPRSSNTRADLLANIAMDSRGEGEVFGQTPPVASGPDPAAVAAAAAALVAPPVTPTLPGIGASSAGAATPASAPATPAVPSSASSAVAAPSPAATSVFAAALAAGGTASSGNILVPSQTPPTLAAVSSPMPALPPMPSPAAAAAFAPVPSPPTAVSTPVRNVVSTPTAAGVASTPAGRMGAVASPTAVGAGLHQVPERRFMVHVAAWTRTESVPGATAAILFEEGPWRRLKVLMRVGRCNAQRQYPQDREHGVEGMAVAADMLRVMGEALEEVEVLGGGKLAAVTNDSQLALILTNASRSRGAKAARSDPFASNPSLSRVLKRWMALDGVLLDTSDENEIASAVILARCCAEPPPVSSLAWQRGPERVMSTAGSGGGGSGTADMSGAAGQDVGASGADTRGRVASGTNRSRGGGVAVKGRCAGSPGRGVGGNGGAGTGTVIVESNGIVPSDNANSAANGGGGAISGTGGVVPTSSATGGSGGATISAAPVSLAPAVTAAATAPSPPPGPAPGATRMSTTAASPFPGFSGSGSDGNDLTAPAPAPAPPVIGGVSGQSGWLKRPAQRIDVEADGGTRKVARTEEATDKGGDGGTVASAASSGGSAALAGQVPI